MKERVQKILSSRGVASRRHAEELIVAGRVTCNGSLCCLGDSADPEIDEILLDGKPLPAKSDYVYLMLHKPKGYVTTLNDEHGRKNAAQLVADCGVRVYPVGRLDMDSEGLLLFTNDGDFANRLMHPKHEVNKTYRVVVKGFSEEGLRRLNKPVVLDGYRIKPPIVSFLRTCSERPGQTELSVTIHEGRNRQVRRMCAIAGMPVVRLIRVQEGNLSLGELPCGKWRYLTAAEIAQMKA